MKTTILSAKGVFCLLFLVSVNLSAQNVFRIPGLAGFLNDNTLNARSEAMGKVTITLDGLQTAFENPAALSTSEQKLSFAFNIDAGNSYFPTSSYSKYAVGYRVNDRIAIGLEQRNWVESDPFFSTIIGPGNFSVDRRSRHGSSLMVAGKITEGLHVGLAGTYIVEKRLEKTKTSDMLLMNAGVIYDKKLRLIRDEQTTNQKIRLAASLFNTLQEAMYQETANDSVFGFRDIPIIFRAGTSFSFSKPIRIGFAERSKWFRDAPQTLDVSAHLQFTDWWESKDHFFTNADHQTMISFGVEGTFYEIVSIRLGYFNETRDIEVDPDERIVTKNRRRALTWGTGFRLPTNRWSNNKFPFETQFDLLVKGMPDILIERLTERIDPQFTDEKTQLSIGLLFKFKKYKEERLSSSPNEEGTF
jgi:hypothetical protein